MNPHADLVEFIPEPQQLARVAVAKREESPGFLIVLLVAVALGLSLTLALPPASTVRHGAVSGSVSANARRAEPLRVVDIRETGER
jgi:hypothetical protein